MLAEDLHQARPDLLEDAIRQWVSAKPFLPKASDLIALMTEILDRRSLAGKPKHSSLQAKCDAMNESLMARGRDDIEWIIDEGGSFQCVIRKEWSQKRAKEIAAQNERDRQVWLHRQRYPVTALRDNPRGEAA